MIHTFADETRWLSNMMTVDVVYDGYAFKSVEHAYQYAKCETDEWRAVCQDPNLNPYQIKRKSKDIVIRDNWDEIKLLVMEGLLIQKYNQEPYQELLLATGNQNIQEGNNWNDTFWGVDLKNSPNIGENHLGRLIMNIRTQLKMR